MVMRRAALCVAAWSSSSAAPRRVGALSSSARRLASSAPRKNAPAQAQGLFEALARPEGAARPAVRVIDLTGSLEDYEATAALQRTLVQEIANEGGADAVVIVEHGPVYTLGRGATHEHVLFDPEAPGAPSLVRVERGGDVTYHGPGQFVAYPILKLDRYLRDSHWYLRALEETVLRTCGALGVRDAVRSEEHTGVWLGDAKIAAVGVAMKKWVTYHGVSLNLDPDMAAYDAIVPCGLDPVLEPVGALNTHLPTALTVADVLPVFLDQFKDVFEVDLEPAAAPRTPRV